MKLNSANAAIAPVRQYQRNTLLSDDFGSLEYTKNPNKIITVIADKDKTARISIESLFQVLNKNNNT